MSCYFEKYKDIFGHPGKDIHSSQIFGISIVDVAVVVLAGLLISHFGHYNLWNVLAVLFISGIFVHRIFCVRKTSGERPFPDYFP
jgi:hypothetical protein